MEVCSSPALLASWGWQVGATTHGDAPLEQGLAVALGTSRGARVVLLREEEGEEGAAEGGGCEQWLQHEEGSEVSHPWIGGGCLHSSRLAQFL